jgi:hypothetical protein
LFSKCKFEKNTKTFKTIQNFQMATLKEKNLDFGCFVLCMDIV